MNEGQKKVFDTLATALLEHIEPLIKVPHKITLLIRCDNDPEGVGDILMSSDTPEGIDEIIARSKKREELNKK